jgi:hypothetical protein
MSACFDRLEEHTCQETYELTNHRGRRGQEPVPHFLPQGSYDQPVVEGLEGLLETIQEPTTEAGLDSASPLSGWESVEVNVKHGRQKVPVGIGSRLQEVHASPKQNQ